jgi:amidohydrolase
MIEAGVLEAPHVDAAFGLHLVQDLPLGLVKARPGPLMAAADTFVLEVRGTGGHGAYPHLCVDPVLVAAHITVALQTLVAREVRPVEPAVVTVASLHAGTAANIIPPAAILTGTVRTFDKNLRAYLAQRIEEVAAGIARSLRAECACTYQWGNPPVVNDPAMTEIVAAAARDVVGAERVVTGEPVMGGEDFASFLEAVPGCFFFVGTRNEERGLTFGHHHPRFDIDEAALPTAIDLLVAVAERYLTTE